MSILETGSNFIVSGKLSSLLGLACLVTFCIAIWIGQPVASLICLALGTILFEMQSYHYSMKDTIRNLNKKKDGCCGAHKLPPPGVTFLDKL